ncbi:hypothetical protein K474DRAFT_1657340 [Panus rudis PR-1116 ss-1]|nr:hypothetical protein K474DRAFT_1657340 [Panus rudis PR-1116 ss-1]
MHASSSSPVRRGSVRPDVELSPPPSATMTDASHKLPPTFTTCLSIPVDGARPIDRLDTAPPSRLDPAPSVAAESKRAPRKSKTEALAALHTHAQSSSSTPDDHTDHTVDNAGVPVKLWEGPAIHVSPKLDMSTVKTPNPNNSPSKPLERPFGLTDCPTFRPTREQWKDPLAYIKSISESARTYGMCKIVPPLGWDMPFVTDTEQFRFKTRLQRLNSIEAASRAKVNFLEALYRYHKQQGNPRVSVPTINHKPLDLWLLRREVKKLGGYEAVTRGKKWADVGRVLGYGGIPGLSTQIKSSYARVILPYEHFQERVRSSPSLALNKHHDPQLKTHMNIQTKTNGPKSANGDSPPSSPLTATSSPLSEPPDESDRIESRLRRTTRQNPQDHQGLARRATMEGGNRESSNGKKMLDEAACEVCNEKGNGTQMLLCDGCDCGFHMYCLDPPLTSIPRGQWFCHICLFGTGGDFGFDEGEEHCLSSFQARDSEFRRLWFQSHPPSHDDDDPHMQDGDRSAPDPAVNCFGDVVVTETDVEKEFWRLVESPNETVEVEYGADVHSTTHGSGMPTLETHPLNPYSKDPWNLNNIPILPDSLLRFIKSDISGMTVPWTYVGMVFSTFCWHNEDHYTYSINYMHWGETKTWYSIPGDDAAKFEAAIRKEAPDLFEAQPDLLFQLVTLMNPKSLKEAGVDVYACNQRAGEFVITFPKAYHAGFNHGFNFNEAVNFALPDWLPYGLDCVKRYQEHRKLPVFSHDELLITITQQSHSIKTAIWLNASLKEMTERELNTRAKARALEIGEVLEEIDRPEEQYQCTICKVFCYLSQITCQCTTKVVCIDHIDDLCKCSKSNRVLRLRFSDMELQDIQAKIAERAAIPTTWRNKLKKLLQESERPPLRSLRALLAEGERINHPLPELPSLRKCVQKANDWVEAANTFIVRKPSRKRPRRVRGRLSSEGTPGSVGEELVDKPERSLEELHGLLREVGTLGFDCQEIATLKGIAHDAEETKAKARRLLETVTSPRDRDGYIQECERLILHGNSLNVHVDEILEVEKIVMREQLLKELEEGPDLGSLSLEHLRQLVARAHACNLNPDHPHMIRLETRLKKGEMWEKRARELVVKPRRTLEELTECVAASVGVNVDPELVRRVEDLLEVGKEYDRQADAWLCPTPSAVKPRVQEVLKLLTRAEREYDIPRVADLRRTTDFAVDTENRCEAVLKNRYQLQPGEEADTFQIMHGWVKYAREHLRIFTLPNVERLDQQLIHHYRWLESLPWYCRQHSSPHGRQILDDVVEATRPEDDLPPNDEYFTCICTTPVRPPAPGTVSDAVQCDHCYARFHGVCAANGGSCPFCDHQHWNGSLHKERNWHFCYLPTILLQAPDITKYYCEDWKQLEIIVHRIDRLSSAIGQFLAFVGQAPNQRAEYIPQVRHYMRKLYKIQFAVSPNPEVSYGLDLAGLHRILAGQPAPIRMKKRRRPKFVFGQDIDKDWLDGTRCICRGRTPYLLHYPTVECELCAKRYHGGCVFAPQDHTKFICPLCCLRKNRNYPYSDVRVKHIDNQEPDIYVDTKEMLDTFSKDVIYIKLPPPYTQTLFVELVRFTPGQPDSVAPNANGGRAGPQNGPMPPMLANGMPPPPRPQQPPPPVAGPSHPPRASPPSAPLPTSFDPGMRSQPPGPLTPNHHVPPPPPWSAPRSNTSRWSSAAATAPPPTARTHHPSEHGSPVSASPPQPQSRKRKYPDDGIAGPSAVAEEIVLSRTSPHPHLPSPKRRQSNGPPPPPAQPGRQNQGLSPSLAMMLSPSPVDARPPPIPGPPPRNNLPPPPPPSYMPPVHSPSRTVPLTPTSISVPPRSPQDMPPPPGRPPMPMARPAKPPYPPPRDHMPDIDPRWGPPPPGMEPGPRR